MGEGKKETARERGNSLKRNDDMQIRLGGGCGCSSGLQTDRAKLFSPIFLHS